MGSAAGWATRERCHRPGDSACDASRTTSGSRTSRPGPSSALDAAVDRQPLHAGAARTGWRRQGSQDGREFGVAISWVGPLGFHGQRSDFLQGDGRVSSAEEQPQAGAESLPHGLGSERRPCVRSAAVVRGLDRPLGHAATACGAALLASVPDRGAVVPVGPWLPLPQVPTMAL